VATEHILVQSSSFSDIVNRQKLVLCTPEHAKLGVKCRIQEPVLPDSKVSSLVASVTLCCLKNSRAMLVSLAAFFA
jgi:hypothetical protein